MKRVFPHTIGIFALIVLLGLFFMAIHSSRWSLIQKNQEVTCQPKWVCTDWTRCDGSEQSRICADENDCGVVLPEESYVQTCEYTALDVYLEFHRGYLVANGYDDVVALTYKYGSSSQVKQLEENMKLIEELPENFRQSVVVFVQSTMPAVEEFENVSQQASEQKTLLTIRADNGSLVGNITMLLENGVWKVDENKWVQH